MEKTKYETKTEVEMSMALPKTLQAETIMAPIQGATVAVYAVYGTDMADRRVWCATFVDRDEAGAWVHASKAYGRAVSGAVIAQQETNDGAGTDSGETAEKPN